MVYVYSDILVEVFFFFFVAVVNVAIFHFWLSFCSAFTLWRRGEKPVRIIVLFVHGVGSLWTVICS